jgi:hypothetical protein
VSNDITLLDEIIPLDTRLLNISLFDDISLLNEISLPKDISLLNDIGLLGGIRLLNISLSNDISLRDDTLLIDISWSNVTCISLLKYFLLLSSFTSSCTKASIQTDTRQEGSQGQKPGWPLKPLVIVRNTQATRSVSAVEP